MPQELLALSTRLNRLSNIVSRTVARNPSRANSDAPSVAVVGAGVVGLSVAFHLLENGARVKVLERTGVGAGASGVQPGGVRQQWGTRANCLMAVEAVSFYTDFTSRYRTRAQASLERCGYVFLASREESLRQLEANIRIQHAAGVRSELLSAEEAASRVPSLDPSLVAGAAYCGDDGYFDRPQAVVEAFAELVMRLGGEIDVKGVRALTRNGDGWELELDDGRTTTSDIVVVATGYETPELLSPLGHELPIATEPRYLFFSEPIQERLLDPLVIAVDRGLAAKQLADGRVLASDLHASGDPESEQPRWRRRIRETVTELLPILEYVSLPIIAPGYYDMTPDGQPIIDTLEHGLWVAAGFSGHGFMVAPAVGSMLAASVGGRELPEWASAVRVERFLAPLTVAEAQVI